MNDFGADSDDSEKYLSGVERGQSENNFDAQGDQNGSLTDG